MQAICDAIISGNADAAEAAVPAHLKDTATIAERLLAEDERT
jgi:DNA-binding GntR family transcriptional regulator